MFNFSNISMLSDIRVETETTTETKQTNKQKETTTLGGPSCWIIKHEITNWFLGRLFYFFPFWFGFSSSFPPFLSLFLFLSPFFFFFFLAEYWGGPGRPCHPACYAPDTNYLSHRFPTMKYWSYLIAGISSCIDLNNIQFWFLKFKFLCDFCSDNYPFFFFAVPFWQTNGTHGREMLGIVAEPESLVWYINQSLPVFLYVVVASLFFVCSGGFMIFNFHAWEFLQFVIVIQQLQWDCAY